MESSLVSKINLISDKGRERAEDTLAVLFMFTYFILPQYFGIDTPFFDFTAQRIFIVLFFFYLLAGHYRMRNYYLLIKHSTGIIWFLLYLLVLTYTAILRTHVGTIMYSLIEFFALFIVAYIVKEMLGTKRFLHLMVVFCYVLCILGVVEYFLKETPFHYLETIEGTYCGSYIRAGSYRIMGPANHALAYGLILVTMLPYVVIDTERDEIDILKDPLLFFLLTLNVFLTGSRSTLGIYLLEVFIMFIFSPYKNKKKVIVYGFIAVCIAVPLLVATSKLSFSRYIIRTFLSVIDQILGTTFSVRFGADLTHYANSSAYRDQLKLLYKVKWLNPLLGQGSQFEIYWKVNGFTIESIDNGYLALYIRYGYPGMITYILYIVTVGVMMLVQGIKKKSGLFLALFGGCVGYFVHLEYMDTLQTIKYVYIFFAIFFACYDAKKKEYIPFRGEEGLEDEPKEPKTLKYSYIKPR